MEPSSTSNNSQSDIVCFCTLDTHIASVSSAWKTGMTMEMKGEALIIGLGGHVEGFVLAGHFDMVVVATDVFDAVELQLVDVLLA